MKLPKSGVEVVLRDSITRSQSRDYELKLFKDVKSDDAEKFAINAQAQQEALVVLMVESAKNGVEEVRIDHTYVDNMDVVDFTALHKECVAKYKEVTTKKN